MQLYEKYRPRTLEEFIGQDRIKKQIQNMTKRDEWDRDAWWIQGPSGTGKTTLAWIMARQLADDMDILELDGDRCNIDTVRQLEGQLQLSSLWGKWKIVIVNEAHAMSARSIQAWLTLLERLPKYRLIIFTTTERVKLLQGAGDKNLFGEFTQPLLSRLKVFTFSGDGLMKEMARRAKQIAKKESLDGQPIKKYEYLMIVSRNNMRQALQRIEQGEMIA